MLIPSLEQLLESDVWHPEPAWAHLIPTELDKRVRAELCPSFFHWIHVLEALFSQWSAKPLDICLHNTGASLWFMIPIWKWGRPGWELSLCAEEWNSGWVTQTKRDFPAANPSHLMGPKHVHGCLCPYVQIYQMWTWIQLIFTHLLQLPLSQWRPLRTLLLLDLAGKAWIYGSSGCSLDAHWGARRGTVASSQHQGERWARLGADSASSIHIVILIYQPLPQRTGSQTDRRERFL